MTPEEQKLVDESFTHMDLESKDLVAERIEQLKFLFPEIAVEGDGSIDFDKLRLILGDEVDEGQERYAFTWPGKADAIRQAQTPSTATLRPNEADSVDWDTTENLYIEGDNLEVLKLLQRGYHGKVKMIYIDPPYNTGHDFVYKDSFQDSIENYKEQAGLSGQSNADTSGRYHSDWLSMMYPRLRLARELLTDDGVIFISIDDNEQKDLKNLCDEVFGEQCSLGCFVWKARVKPANVGSAKYRPQQELEYVLAYEKFQGKSEFVPLYTGNQRSYPKELDGRRYRLATILKSNRGVNQRSTMIFEAGGYTPPEGQRWQAGKDEIDKLFESGHIEFTDNAPMRRYFEDEEEPPHDPLYNFMAKEWSSTSEIGKEELNELVGEFHGFDTVKPTRLIQTFIAACLENNQLIMDFFSGSGTTAQAVFQQNAIDGKRRKYILVQHPELTKGMSRIDDKEIETLTELAEERIRRAGQKIKAEIEEENKQPKLGEQPKSIPDIGFRVLRLDSSNFDQVEGGALVDNLIKSGRTHDDIIFEMMLKWGLELSLPMEKAEVAGYPITSIAADELICCMDEGLTVEVLEAIAALEPKRVFFLDSVLTDTIKLNAAQIFKRVGDKLGYEIELRTA